MDEDDTNEPSTFIPLATAIANVVHYLTKMQHCRNDQDRNGEQEAQDNRDDAKLSAVTE